MIPTHRSTGFNSKTAAKPRKHMKKLVIAIASACLLSACATPFRDYEGTANRVALANICEKEGLISNEAFSHYASFQFGEYPRQWIVDEGKLRSMYLSTIDRSGNWRPRTEREREEFRLNCAQIATVAQRVRPSASAQQQIAPTNTYTPPTTTNCMTTYGWTRCTTN